MWIFSKWRWASLAPAEDASCPFNSFHPSLLVKTGCFTFSSGSCCHYVFHYRCDPEILKFLILLILYTEAPWSPHPLLPTCRHSHAAASVSWEGSQQWWLNHDSPLSIPPFSCLLLAQGLTCPATSWGFPVLQLRLKSQEGRSELGLGRQQVRVFIPRATWPPAEGLSSREAALFPASLLHLCAGEMLAPLNSAGGSGSLAFVSPVWTHGFHTACSYSCLKTKQNPHKHLP